MSDARRIFGSIPTGRRLEEPGYDPSYLGTVGPLRRADAGRLKLARRNLREIPDKDIEGEGRYLLDKSNGETLEVITSFVDLIDVKLTGATAFTVREGLLVPLRPRGWKNPADQSNYAGTIAGRQAVGMTLCVCPPGLSPMSQPFWQHYPKKSWLEVDWQAWEKAGRPRVPRHLELESPHEQRLDPTLPLPPPGPQSAVTTLFPRKSRRDVSARSRGIDRWLEERWIR